MRAIKTQEAKTLNNEFKLADLIGSKPDSFKFEISVSKMGPQDKASALLKEFLFFQELSSHCLNKVFLSHFPEI